MLKKFFTFLGVVSLICFSFYYTDSAVDIVKRNDPIMKEIVESSSNYFEDSIDAVLIDNNIIPGISGVKVDVDKSYEKMKNYGSYDSGLLVFEEITPTISTSNTYDKFIIKGNSSKQSVSLIFKLKTTNYIDEVLEILKDKNVKVTFFIIEDILYNDIDILEKIYLSGHDIEVLSLDYSSSTFKKSNKILKSLMNTKSKYCYTEIESSNIIDNCKRNKMHSIIPNIITTNFPYTEIKNNVTSGSMISLSNNVNTIRELPSIINYLNQKGYKIVTIDELLDE